MPKIIYTSRKQKKVARARSYHHTTSTHTNYPELNYEGDTYENDSEYYEIREIDPKYGYRYTNVKAKNVIYFCEKEDHCQDCEHRFICMTTNVDVDISPSSTIDDIRGFPTPDSWKKTVGSSMKSWSDIMRDMLGKSDDEEEEDNKPVS